MTGTINRGVIGAFVSAQRLAGWGRGEASAAENGAR